MDTVLDLTTASRETLLAVIAQLQRQIDVLEGKAKSPSLRTRAFTELQSHYLFEDRFGRPGKGNDKGKVEGMVGYVRRNFLVPVPSFQSFDALNAHLEERCLARMDSVLRGHDETIGQG